jgi:hypothetical protein
MGARRNKIAKLRDVNGLIQTVPTKMQRMSVFYFKYRYAHDPSFDCMPFTSLIREHVTEVMNEDSLMHYSKLPPLNPLVQIASPVRFYRRNWKPCGLM